MIIGASACPGLKARRNGFFARNELSRLCLGVLRTTAGELLSTDDIARVVIVANGFDVGDGILRGNSRTGRFNRQAAAPPRRNRQHRRGAREQMEAGVKCAVTAYT